MKQKLAAMYQRALEWQLSEARRHQLRGLRTDARRAFTEHPEQTGESYWQHLWFTITMSLRFLYTTAVLLIHGLFPFLLTKAASKEIERIYRIMKGRIPKSQRDIIDADYSV